MKTKTFEEKSADYIRIKNRIFNNIDETPTESSSPACNDKNQANATYSPAFKQPQQQYTILNNQNSDKRNLNEPTKTFKPTKNVNNKKPFMSDRLDKSVKNFSNEYFSNSNSPHQVYY